VFVDLAVTLWFYHFVHRCTLRFLSLSRFLKTLNYYSRVLKHFSPVKKNAKGTGTMPGIKIKTKLFFFIFIAQKSYVCNKTGCSLLFGCFHQAALAILELCSCVIFHVDFLGFIIVRHKGD